MKGSGYGKLAKLILQREIETGVAGSQNVFVTEFSRVSVNRLFELRRDLRKRKAALWVVKNSLARRALEARGLSGLAGRIKGQCALGLTNDDPAKVSKVLVAFSEENAGFMINGAWLGGKILEASGVKALALLPGREELLGRVAGGLMAPISGFVTVLNRVLVGFVNVLDAIRKSKQA